MEHTKTETVLKIQNDVITTTATTTEAYLILRSSKDSYDTILGALSPMLTISPVPRTNVYGQPQLNGNYC